MFWLPKKKRMEIQMRILEESRIELRKGFAEFFESIDFKKD